MIRFENICKAYAGRPAVVDVSFAVDRGELFGLIGPDGAGKSTLFRILTTVLLADSGRAFFDGRDVVRDRRHVRRHVGYMPGRFSLYQDLSVTENLEFFATIFGTTVAANYGLIKDLFAQLAPFGGRRAGALSGGMKQKLALSCALIHNPRVLVLDEPTFGVDAVSRREFWNILGQLQARGVTILVSTPYMDEAELCDRVALIQTGHLLRIDTPQGVRDSFDKHLYTVTTGEIHAGLNALATAPELGPAYSFGQEIHLYAPGPLNPTAIEKVLAAHGLTDAAIGEGTPQIEDCFMDLMVTGAPKESVVE